MNPAAIAALCEKTLPPLCRGPREDDALFALPASALSALQAAIAQTPEIQRAFEFGSGRSTRLFLDAGLEVTSLEDSAHWLDETGQALPPELLSRWTPACQPLTRVWHRGAPFSSWELSDALREKLASADLVLIDSPVLPPMREHALLVALRHARQALIVVDDVNIPSVARYCRRLAERNRLPHHFTAMGHGLCFLGAASGPLDETRGVLNTLRAWRLYAIRRRFLPPPPCAS